MEDRVRFPADQSNKLALLKRRLAALAFPERLPPLRRIVAEGKVLFRTMRPCRTVMVPLKEWFPPCALNSRSPVPFLVIEPVPESVEFEPKVMLPFEVRKVGVPWAETFIKPPGSARMPEISRFDPRRLDSVAFAERFREREDDAE